MANNNGSDDLGLGNLGLDDINFDFDPVKDKRKPIVKISTSFGKSMTAELKTYGVMRTVALAALPKGYGMAYQTAAEVIGASKKLYYTAASELRPVVPDVKRAVQKILPKTDKILPEKVRNKLDAMTKPDVDRLTSPSPEELQNREIAGSIASIFQTQLQYTAEENAKNSAYKQIRDQIKDDQYRSTYRTLSTMSAGISRLVAYQEQVTSNYQRKSLELQYRQYFATRELLKVTAMGTADMLAHLKGILHNTGLPDFSKSNEFGKLENNLAKHLAESLFPNSQRFINQYFANFSNVVSGKVRENLVGFIDGLRGIQDVREQTAGLDKHTLAGEELGRGAAALISKRLGQTIKKRYGGNKLIQRFGHKLSYKLGNLPAKLNNFAKDRTDYTDKYGFLGGSLVNLFRDILPVVGEGSNVVGRSTLMRSDETVPFNLAARQSLTEIIPGFLSRIHHELLVMRTGDTSAPRLMWNPTKGQFTTTKVLGKDIYKHIYKKPELENVSRKTADFVNTIDKLSTRRLSPEAREAIRRKTINDAIAGTPFNPREFMEEMKDVSPEVAKEIRDHFKLIFHIDERGRDTARSNYRALDAAKTAHESAVNAVPGIKERITAFENSGFGDSLRGLGVTSMNEEGESIFNRDHFLKALSGKGDIPEYNDPYHHIETMLSGNMMGGMRGPATGYAGDNHTAGVIDKMGEKVDEFTKATDKLLTELQEGNIFREEKKQVETLEKILQILQTKSFKSGADLNRVLGKAKGGLSGLKDRVVEIGNDGTAWVKDKLGNLHQVDIADLAQQAKNKVRGAHQAVKENKGRGLVQRYRDYMASPAEGVLDQTGHFIGSALGVVGGAVGLGYRGAKLGGRMAYGILKPGVKLATGTVKLGYRTLRGVGHVGAHLLRPLSDVFVEGQKKPALYAKYMKQGRYVDAVDGKPIYSPHDIHGPVKDTATDQIVLTAEEYAHGLYDSRGRKISKGIVGGIMGLTAWMTKLTLITPMKVARAVLKVPGKIYRAARRIFTYDTDIYVGGEKLPRLYGTKMAQGAYICVPTNKIIHKASDIKGEVKDVQTGQILISKEDLDRGIYNSLGHNLTRLIKAAWSVAGIPFKAAKLAFHATMGVAHGALDLVTGGVKKVAQRLAGTDAKLTGKAGLKVLQLQLDTQKAIFKLLHERIPKPKRIRKNSWEDKFLQTQDAEKEAKRGGMKGLFARGKGMFGGIGGLLSKLFHRGKDEGDEDQSGGSDSGDMLNDYLMLKDAKAWMKKRKRIKELRNLVKSGKATEEDLKELNQLSKAGKFLGKGGRIARGLGKLGRLGSKALRFARFGRGASLAGEAVEGAEGLAGAGEAVGGLATAGEVAGGAAAAAGEVGLAGSLMGGLATAGGAIAGAAGAIGTGLAAVGTAVAGILTAPVLLVAGAVALLGVGAYLAYKWYKGRGPKDLINVRLAQYGIDKDNSREVEKVLKLEDTLSKCTQFQGTRASIDMKKVDIKAILDDFGVDIKDTRAVNAWATWFHERFEPVYLNFIQAVKAADSKVELGNADKDLKADKKLEVLKQMKKLDRGIYQVNANPFAGQKKFIFWHVGNIQVGTYWIDKAFYEAETNLQKEAAKEKKEGGGKEGGGKLKIHSASMTSAQAAAAAKAAAEKGKAKAHPGDKNAPSQSKTAVNAANLAKSVNNIAGGTTKLVSNVVQFKPITGALSALQSVRFKTYGLGTLSIEKANTLNLLELASLAEITVGAQGQAVFNGDVGKFFEKYCSEFGLVNTDKAAKKNWTDWFTARFLPTLLQFVTGVYTVNPRVKPQEADRFLKPNQQMQVAKITIGAKAGKEFSGVSVWSINISPWPNYKLNIDSKSTDANLDYLKSQVDAMVFQEKQAAAKQQANQDKGTTQDKSKTTAPQKASKPQGSTTPSTAKAPTSATLKSSSNVIPFPKTSKSKPVASNSSSGGGSGGIVGLPGGAGYGSSLGGDKDVSISKRAAITELRDQMTKMGITDPRAQANILANIQAESNFKPRSESLHYSASRLCQVFPSHFSSVQDAAACIAQGPEAVGNRIYGGRMGNAPDEGYMYRGRGYIQLTGKAEYARMSKLIGIDLVQNPDLANKPEVAAKIAVAYIKDRMHGKDLTDPNAVTAAVDPANLQVEQAKRSRLAQNFLKNTPATSTSGNGMASSSSALAANQVSPTKRKFGIAATAMPTGVSPTLSQTTQTAKPAEANIVTPRAIARTPAPDISQPVSRMGGMMYAVDDRTVGSESNRINMQRTATANDELARQSIEAENAKTKAVTDVLNKSLEVQKSMDATLKAIYKVVSEQGSNGSPSTQNAGPLTAANSKGSSTPPPPAPVDVGRKYG